MRYATWRLDWADPQYGTGPESLIVERGGTARGIVANPDVVTGTILGVVSGDFDTTGLDLWGFTEIATDAALAFAQQIAPEATLDDDGQIVWPLPAVSDE